MAIKKTPPKPSKKAAVKVAPKATAKGAAKATGKAPVKAVAPKPKPKAEIKLSKRELLVILDRFAQIVVALKDVVASFDGKEAKLKPGTPAIMIFKPSSPSKGPISPDNC